jgi:predicted alpha/beta-hydrolase family hydrolase
VTTSVVIPLASTESPAATDSVSGLLLLPPGARALYVLAHGAGAGMRHAFLESVSQALAAHAVGTLRYQFPYMEAGRKRTDVSAVAEATVAAAVRAAQQAAPGVPLIAGGKSFGGRMTSGAAAKGMIGAVRGLVFLGFPLHPPGKPSTERAAHLGQVPQPMLFLQGTRDEFAALELLRPLVERLGPRATLYLFDGGDHSLKVRGRAPAQVLGEAADAVAGWVQRVL